MRGEPLETSQQRAAHYIESGWWTGEPLHERFRRHVIDAPDALAVVDDLGRSFRRGELWEEAGTLAGVFSDLTGPVILIMANTGAAVAVFLGALRASVLPATLPATADAMTIAAAATKVGASAIVGLTPETVNRAHEAARIIPHRLRVGLWLKLAWCGATRAVVKCLRRPVRSGLI